MMQFFAHAGEEHATPTQATVHLLQEWYIALPLFVLTVIGFVSLVYFLSHHSKPITYMSMVALLFVSGVLMYNTSAIVSIAALAGGMTLVLVSVIASLARPEKK